MIRPLTLCGALCLATAATAQPSLGCWQPGEEPGVFGWPAAPSVACRDGSDAVTDGNPDRRTPAQPRTSDDRRKPGNGTNTEFTFSGEVYFGLGVSF